MRRKISTILDVSLTRQVKLEAVRQGKQISEIIAEALRRYLAASGRRSRRDSVVAETWGSLEMEKDRVRQLLEEEEALLDS